MAKKKDNSELVNEYIQKLDTNLAEIVQSIREMVLSTDKEIAEQIKWNSPSFYYSGEMQDFNPKEYKRDILVINLHKGYPLLVFPTGAKVTDNTGVLEGDYKDGRRVAQILDMEMWQAKKSDLQKVIIAWLALVEK